MEGTSEQNPKSCSLLPLRPSAGRPGDAMRLKHLESALQDVTLYSELEPGSLRPDLEQYSTSPHLAAILAHTAHAQYDDIEGQVVADIGCGTAILGISAAILGASDVLGFDVDTNALACAAKNIANMEVGMGLIQCDVAAGDLPVRAGCVDTVLMNPPFGTRRQGVDIIFLERALQIARKAVYSMHKTSTRDFIVRKGQDWGVNITVLAQMRFDIPATHKFHKKKSVDVDVDLIRISKTT